MSGELRVLPIATEKDSLSGLEGIGYLNRKSLPFRRNRPCEADVIEQIKSTTYT